MALASLKEIDPETTAKREPCLICCPLCGGADDVFLKGLPDPLNPSHFFRLVQCRSCHMVYLNPRPPIESLANYYDRDFVSYQMECRFGPSIRTKLFNQFVESIPRRRVDLITRFLKPSLDRRVLDVGCGRGAFIKHLSNRQLFSVSGTDFDAASVAACHRQGLDVSLTQDHRLTSSEETFDAMTLWHVLEHDPHPVQSLARLKMYLKDNGLVFILVPNIDSWENRLFGRWSYLYDAPRHLVHFSEHTLRQTLAAAGLEVMTVECVPNEGGWFGSLQNVIFGGRVFNQLYERIFSLFSMAPIGLCLDFLSAKWKKGSVLFAVARRASNAVGSVRNDPEPAPRM